MTATHDSMWTEAARDTSAEADARVFAHVRVAATAVWPWLAGAQSQEEYVQRKALADDRLTAAVASVAGALDLDLKQRLTASLDEDFTVLHAERAAARIQATLAKTAHTVTAGNPYPVGTPNWFEYEDPDGAFKDDPGRGPSNGVPRDLFPDGVPLRGDLTPEQQAWLKRRSSLTKRAETCSVCSDETERDPAGEDNRTWHHSDGTSHDHEAKPGGDDYAEDMSSAASKTAVTCSCAHNSDGTVTKMLCPAHAPEDPCATMAAVTGQRRRGSIVRGTCTACGWSANKTAAKNAASDTGTASRTALVTVAGKALKGIGKTSDPNVFSGTDSQGQKVYFKVSDSEAADLRAVMYSDLAANFSGVEVDPQDVVMNPDLMKGSAKAAGWSSLGSRLPFAEAMRKGAPFADYDDFDDCTSKNRDKDDPDAYCGEVKRRTEDKKTSSNSTVTCPRSPSGLHVFHGRPECMFCGFVPPKKTSAFGDDAWDHGLDADKGEGQQYSCYLSMDCPFTGNAQQMEEHYAHAHLDSANRDLLHQAALQHLAWGEDGGVYTGGPCRTEGCHGTVTKTADPGPLTGVKRYKCSECGQTYRGPREDVPGRAAKTGASLDVLLDIQSHDPDGMTTQPQPEDYTDFKAWVVRTYGADAWADYNQPWGHQPGDDPLQAAASTHTAATCPDCGGTGSVPAGGHEPPEDVDDGYVACPTCGGTGEVDDAAERAFYEGSLAALVNMTPYNGRSATLTYTTDHGVQTDHGTIEITGSTVVLHKGSGVALTIPTWAVMSAHLTGEGDEQAWNEGPGREPSPVDYAFSGAAPWGAFASNTTASAATYVPVILRRQAVDESAQGTDRYQRTRHPEQADWIDDEFDEGYDETLQQGRAGAPPHTPVASRRVQANPYDPTTNPYTTSGPGSPSTEFSDGQSRDDKGDAEIPGGDALTTRPRVVPSGGGNDYMPGEMTDSVRPPADSAIPTGPGTPGPGDTSGNQQPNRAAASRARWTEPPQTGRVSPAQQQRVLAKMAEITEGLLTTNPGMNRDAARHLAAETLHRYPGMVR
jgi:hypothetical protein